MQSRRRKQELHRLPESDKLLRGASIARVNSAPHSAQAYAYPAPLMTEHPVPNLQRRGRPARRASYFPETARLFNALVSAETCLHGMGILDAAKLGGLSTSGQCTQTCATHIRGLVLGRGGPPVCYRGSSRICHLSTCASCDSALRETSKSPHLCIPNLRSGCSGCSSLQQTTPCGPTQSPNPARAQVPLGQARHKRRRPM
ncbi:hypothetical protein BJV78DRAFT_654595 [Lactifluus subvellereus]|nr:hypothetical protein BJV78DRAFT_654595 [Lactifluus subvellereus]